MGKSRNSYNNQYDDSNYELLHQFEPAIEIPSDDDLDDDTKPEISPKLHQRLMASALKAQRDLSPPHNAQNQSRPHHRPPPKLRAIPQLNLMDVHSLLARTTVGQTTISPAPMHPNHNQQLQSASSTSSNGKRRKTDEVTTTGCGASSNDEYPTASSPNANSSTDDDYHFLMSLQPYLTQISAPQKLRLRMRIQKLIFKELYKDEIDD